MWLGEGNAYHYKDGQVWFHESDGAHFTNASHDLIEEWSEPRKFEGEIIVIESVSNGQVRKIFQSQGDRSVLEYYNRWKIIARKRVTIMEGEFDD